MVSDREFDQFVIALIRAGGWELRYNPANKPYAALLDGFGGSEQGVKLHFTRQDGFVKVTGVIDLSEKIRIRRPHILISLEEHPAKAAQEVACNFLPHYQEIWKKAQPKIEAFLKSRKNRKNEEPRS